MNAKEAEAFGALEERIAELAQKVGQLQAKLDAVPVDALRRQYNIGDYKQMSTQDYAGDAIYIARWLRSLDGSA